MAENISAKERARLFNNATRENVHMMAKKTVTEALANVEFTFPKARLLSKVYMMVDAKIKVTGAEGAVADLPELLPYRILKRVGINLNNGFLPYNIDGEKLAMLNMIQMHPQMVMPSEKGTNCTFSGLTAGASGVSNDFSFCLEVPLTLNESVNTGLVLLQNSETMVQLTADIASPSDILVKDGYTVEIEKVEITPALVTFTIPSISQAFPSLNILKLVSARTQTFAGSGENIIKLNVGTIYRKLVLYLTDENGNPLSDEDINGNIEIKFNTADTPYSINPRMLRYINSCHLGMVMPKGMYIFDFSTQGQIANCGGSRDLIDTERVQEFTVSFPSEKAGKITVISENLTQLK